MFISMNSIQLRTKKVELQNFLNIEFSNQSNMSESFKCNLTNQLSNNNKIANSTVRANVKCSNRNVKTIKLKV